MSDTVYKPLETDFTKTGFRFRLIRREGDIAIYHKVALEGPQHPTTYDAGFETIVISRHDRIERAPGVWIDPAEQYPSPEQWGTKGWTYKDLYGADLRYERLLGRLAEAETPIEETDDPEEGVEQGKKTRRPKGTPIVLTIPDGEFSVKELAEFNKVEYPTAYLWVKEHLDVDIVATRTERRAARGKETQLYQKKA